MTRREKVLALCVGGTLSGVALVALVRWAVLEPFHAAQQQIAAEQRKSRKLNADLTQLSQVEKDWQALAARTLAGAWDPNRAERRFREDMHQLCDRHGLSDPQVSAGTFTKYKDGSVGVPLRINATGTLKAIVGFLCDFYCREYLARLDKVRITADQSVITDVDSARRGGGSARGRRGSSRTRHAALGPHGPELRISINAATIVLPKLGDVEHPVMEEIVEGIGEGAECERLLRDRIEYNTIFAKNLFVPYQKKPLPVVRETQPDETAPREVVTRERVVDRRAGADRQFVRGTTCLNGELIAYVEDERRLDQPPEQYRLDEEIDDGTLILIHPRGLVVRVNEGGAKERDYFYCLGLSFSEREELNPGDHPEVWEALEHEFLSEGVEPDDGLAGTRRLSAEKQGG